MLKLKSTTRTFKEQWLLQQLEIVQVNILSHLLKIQSTVALETCLSKINQKKNKKVPNNLTLKQTLTKKLQPKVTKRKKLLNKRNHQKRKKLRNQKKISKTLVTMKLKMKTPIISRVMMLRTDNQRSSSWAKMMKMMMTIMATAILTLIRILKRMGIVMMITIMKMNKKRQLKLKLLTY